MSDVCVATDENEHPPSPSSFPRRPTTDDAHGLTNIDAEKKRLLDLIHSPFSPTTRLLYCMEYLEHHLGEVIRLLKDRLGIDDGTDNNNNARRPYLLFDLPGQIELTAHSNVIYRIASRLSRELDMRLACVQLVDAAVCLTDVSKFIGAALVCTASMMRLGESVRVGGGMHSSSFLLLTREIEEGASIPNMHFSFTCFLHLCPPPLALHRR